MAESETEQSRFAKGFLIGSILGILAGMLFAPKAGKELRADLKQKGEEVFDEAKQLYSETRSKANVILEDARRRAEELIKEANRQLAEARQKAREVLKGAEEKAGEGEAKGAARKEAEEKIETGV